ncbi:MAG TPA: YciI family protein [Chloroflexota bacterium]|nr:YciI family protein [Chloroflexota bacterium]
MTGTETKPKRYIALIYTDESREQSVSPEEQQKIMAAYFQYTEDARKAGVYVAGDALEGTNLATTVRIRDGKRQTTDGPFAETKEQLGGFYILKCKDLDEALEWAAKIPASQYGSIEVRPLMEFE